VKWGENPPFKETPIYLDLPFGFQQPGSQHSWRRLETHFYEDGFLGGAPGVLSSWWMF